MIYAQYLNGVLFDPVRNNVRGIGHNQFFGAGNTPRASQSRLQSKHGNSINDFQHNFSGSGKIIPRNI